MKLDSFLKSHHQVGLSTADRPSIECELESVRGQFSGLCIDELRGQHIDVAKSWFSRPTLTNLDINRIDLLTLEIRDALVNELQIGVARISKEFLCRDSHLRGGRINMFECLEGSASQSTFQEVQIEQCRLRVKFDACDFRHLRIASGLMSNCAFVNCTFEDVDMRDLLFADVSFFHRGRYQPANELPLLPDRADNFLCDSKVIAQTLRELDPKLRPRSHTWVNHLASLWERPINHEVCLVDQSIFSGELHPDDVSTIMSVLFERRIQR